MPFSSYSYSCSCHVHVHDQEIGAASCLLGSRAKTSRSGRSVAAEDVADETLPQLGRIDQGVGLIRTENVHEHVARARVRARIGAP